MHRIEREQMPIPTILITGGASGSGAGIATRLAKDGARIIIADRDTPQHPFRPLRYFRGSHHWRAA
jgi:NAD(P)-dependent dehydrogenase (short-subunit alcohol dehydrogenase family)